MKRTMLSCLAIVAGVTPAVAQLTPQQRQEAEFRAVQNTIGETRQLEAERRSSDDALRGLRCGSAVGSEITCGGPHAGALRFGAPVRYRPSPDTTMPRQWVGFGSAPQPREQLHELGSGTIRLKAGKATIMTLGANVGGVEKPLMIRTAIRPDHEEPVWSHMGEISGDPQGRYLVTIPALAPGTYQIDVQVTDPDRPLAPASTRVGQLIVR